jgi:hypothetical protein
MQKDRLTKTMSLEKELVLTIEKIAQENRRSFTQQTAVLLESAIRQQYGLSADGYNTNSPAQSEAKAQI